MSEKVSYHHGDLRNALIIAAAELAESGGPEAVTIRAAAREVGVTPTATYRHFADRDELMEAARDACLDRMAAYFLELIEEVPADLPPIERAVERFRASGRAYVQFAQQQEGLYRMCFCTNPEREPSDTAPYQMLSALLDELVEVGAIPESERHLAEAPPWAAVHGLALLLIDGPLSQLDEPQRRETTERVLSVIARGLGAQV